jgi:peptidoglycan/xylan/chitin deacetylase (PgdA/CDA1 family)
MKKILKNIIKFGITLFCLVVVVFLLVAGSYLKQHYTVPIIMYHSVGNALSDKTKLLTVSGSTFERQMRFLREHKYNVISLRQLATLMKENKRIIPKTVVVTFDDGYRDNLTVALPVLKKYNIPMTLFVAPLEISEVPYYLRWDELEQLAYSPLIEIGAHAIHHAFLPDIKDEKRLRLEIINSKKMLEERLGLKVEFFSYPAGGFNKKIKQIVLDSGYLAAVATKPGINYANDDVYALKRMRISEKDKNLFYFWLKISGFYGPLRDWQRRYKDANIGYD